MDFMDSATRSRVMSQIRDRNTRPELIVRRYLHSRGLRYKLHEKRLPGKPDLAFISRKIAVFVHGCFWHAHSHCDTWRLPRSRENYWAAKLLGNKQRDHRHVKELRKSGWRVTTIWACSLSERKLDWLYRFITKDDLPSRTDRRLSRAPRSSE